MSDKLIPLDAWARAQYGEHAPTVWTLRRWARDGRIFPLPVKHGRSYFVRESARYVDDLSDPAFMRQLSESTATR